MENQSLFVQIPIYIYVIIALVLIIITVFKTDKINDEDKDVIFPFTVLASILWPIVILMFLLVRIDQKGLNNYDKGEKEQSNNGEDKHE